MDERNRKKYMNVIHYTLLMCIVLVVVIELSFFDNRTQTSKLEKPVLTPKEVIRIHRENGIHHGPNQVTFQGKEVIVRGK